MVRPPAVGAWETVRTHVGRLFGAGMENVHLIVGLGNPEAEYARTRHNAGFLAVERLAAEAGASWSGERRLRAKLARARIGERPVLLALPQTGMNVSGEAVRALMDYFQVPRERLL